MIVADPYGGECKADSCPCDAATAQHDQFSDRRSVGCDATDGRYADVAILQCKACGQLWLRYFVEYEGFSRSGRWARGRIDAVTAKLIRPEEGAQFLADLPSYLFGGSWFRGQTGERSGPMHWSI